MEFQKLNSTSGSEHIFQPTAIFDNYDSLIWTERYHGAGDFELVSSNVKEALDTFPLESYVGLRSSTVPMIVESWKIEKPKGKHARVTIKGRSFESVLERRASVKQLDAGVIRPLWTENADQNKQSDAVYKAIRKVLGDIARTHPTAVGTDKTLALVNPFNLADKIPEINLPFPTDYTAGVKTPYEIKAGNLYAVVLEMLDVNHHGIRAIRPLPGKTTVDLEIYNGADLRATAVFDARFDQFDNANYLLSFQGSTNVAFVYGPNGATQKLKNTAPEPTGLSRRVKLVDETSEATLNTDAARQSRGLVELYNNNAIALFDGETSVQIADLYNKPIAQGGYGLGDILKLQGEYNLTRNVRVAEFIRSSDSSGEKAYPTFQVVDE